VGVGEVLQSSGSESSHSRVSKFYLTVPTYVAH
jgi:hypothetical protein